MQPGTWPAWLALVLGLLVTGAATWRTRSDVELLDRRDFVFACQEILAKIQDRLVDHVQVLRSGAALFDASDTVTRGEWRRFVERLKLEELFPGIQGIGYAELIPRDGLAAHTAAVRAEGFPAYSVWPEVERDVYTSIVYLEPFSGRNLRAFGYDMRTEPIRRAAMERARDADAAALTGKVVLVQETGQDVQAGTLLYVPVYRKGADTRTVEGRRAALVGWVYSPYRMKDLMRGILGGWDASGTDASRRVRLEVFDGDAPSPAALLHDTAGTADAAGVGGDAAGLQQAIERIDFAGRRWTLRLTRSAPRSDGAGFARVWLVLGLGVAVSVLLFALVLSLLATRRRAREIAARLTAELAASEEKLRRIVENVPDVIYRLELVPERRFTFLSPAVETITGYTPREHYADPGLSLRTVHPDDLERLRRAFSPRVVSGAPLVLRWVRKDGVLVWTEQRNRPVFGPSGELVAVEGIARDVTARKRDEEVISHLNAHLQRRTVELEAANEELAAFARSVSHDLKAPLRALTGFGTALLEDCGSLLPAEGRGHVERIREAAARMTALVDDLFRLAQVTGAELNAVPVDLGVLSAAIAADLRASEPGRRVDWLLPASLEVTGDEGLLRVVLENLLRNAWKFTSRKATARIELGESRDDGHRVLFVRDDGAGFDPRHASLLFRPFRRLHDAGEFPGSGIGLATVANIVRRHGGRVWAEGRPGHGATFFFTLPEGDR